MGSSSDRHHRQSPFVPKQSKSTTFGTEMKKKLEHSIPPSTDMLVQVILIVDIFSFSAKNTHYEYMRKTRQTNETTFAF